MVLGCPRWIPPCNKRAVAHGKLAVSAPYSDSGERIDSVLGAALFESRNHRLGCIHTFGKLSLTELGLGPQIANGLPEIQVVREWERDRS